MRFSPSILSTLLFVPLIVMGADQAEPVSQPRPLDDRLKIELFAEHPDLATPTGIDVDHQGRVWVIESNTHFPPEGYNRHPSDRILVMHDKNGDGRATADEINVFADGLTFTMSIVVRPLWLDVNAKRESQSSEKRIPPASGERKLPVSSLSIFIATRNEILLLADVDGDLKCDTRERLVHLETKGNYPHNGLAGITFDALGWMYFGFGENLGEDYQIIGSDGITLSGGGEGGNMYRCRPNGSELKQWATGFWNPHASCVDAFGRLFTVDNDADSRPPCRLLHIIPDGDYGYRFRLGRKGLHPFTSWNGEIPGTLPMVAGTGEAPSGILAYESDGLPDDYIGNLIVTSWGDHRIDRFRLTPRGASFESLAESIVQGDENFRPVGIACAPDGSLYFSDWVLRDYKLHGKGRVWRVSAKEERADKKSATENFNERDIADLKQLTNSRTLAVRRLAARALSNSNEGRIFLRRLLSSREVSQRQRIEALWAIALIPLEVEDMRIDRATPDMAPIALSGDEVAIALISLINQYGQFRMNPEEFDLKEDGLTWFRKPEPETFSLKQAERILATAHIELGFDYMGEFMVDLNIHDSLHDLLYPVLWEPYNFLGGVNDLATSAKSADQIMTEMDLFRPVHYVSPDFESWRKTQYLLAARKRDPQYLPMAKYGLESSSEIMKFAAVQWVAEEHLVGFRPQVENILNDPTITADLFLATLAALEMLDGIPPQEFDKTPPGKYVLPIVKDDARPAAVRALALKLVPPTDPALDGELLANLLRTDDLALKRETIRTLNASPVPQATELLRSIVKDDRQPLGDRIDATVGLATSASALDQKTLETLADLTYGAPAQFGTDLYIEALRSLRGVSAKDATLDLMLSRLAPLHVPKTTEELDLAEQLAFALIDTRYGIDPAVTQAIAERRPTNANEWLAEVERGGDAERGRRVFFHANSAGCYKCHTYDGRGGKVGPDLTNFGRNVSAERIIASLLMPSQEVAPQFTTWTMIDDAGRVHTGMIVHENEGKTILGDADGKLIELNTIDIVERTPQKTSVMPEKLIEKLTVQEVRDLVAFLRNATKS